MEGVAVGLEGVEEVCPGGADGGGEAVDVPFGRDADAELASGFAADTGCGGVGGDALASGGGEGGRVVRVDGV